MYILGKMGKSRKKHSYVRIAGKSDKSSRTIANRKLRHLNRVIVCKGKEPKLLREVSNVYDFSSDGLANYFTLNEKSKKWLRK